MLMRKIGFLIIVLISIYSCKSDPNAESIKVIDGLLTEISKAENGLNSFTPEKVMPYIDTISFDVKFIEQEYKDTMSLELGTRVDGYYRIIKSISKFEKTYKDQKKDILYSRKQLNNLKSDLSTGVLDSSLLAMYLPTEAEAVERLLESNSNLKIWYDNIESNFVIKRRPIDSLIKVIKINEGY